MSEPSTADPEVGSIWQGGGMTVRVLEVWRDEHDGDVRVERLTGRRGLLKRPAKGGLIPLSSFASGRMKPLDPSKDSTWTRKIQERYGRA